MSKRKIIFLASLAAVSLLLTGALRPQDFPGHSPGFALTAAAVFEPGPVSLPDGWTQQPALAYLDGLVQTFQPTKVPWLDVELWQRFHDQDIAFTASGRLVWGATHRARVEWNVKGRSSSSLRIVSDGKRLERSIQLGKLPPEIEQYRLPAGADHGTQPKTWKYLERHGCTVIPPLLSELRSRGQDWQLQTGRWRDRPVLRLTAKMTPAGNGAVPRLEADQCRLFLAADNLWPLRLEWSRNACVFLEMEFRRPRVDPPAQPQEIAKIFSFSDP